MRLAHDDHGGDGPVLVLLHAFPLDRCLWDRLVPLVQHRFRVITVDLPGLGASPVPDEEPSMAVVGDGVRALLDDLGVATATVFGISTGGYVALELARSSPGRLAGLVLGSTTPWLVEPDDPAQRRRTADEVEATASTEPVAGSADEGLGVTAHRDQPELVSLLRDTIARADPAGVAWLARAIAARADTSAALSAYAGRVLLVFGEEDTATPPERARQMLALRDPGLTSLAVLSGTGHLTALEQPEAVAAQLAELGG